MKDAPLRGIDKYDVVAAPLKGFDSDRADGSPVDMSLVDEEVSPSTVAAFPNFDEVIGIIRCGLQVEVRSGSPRSENCGGLDGNINVISRDGFELVEESIDVGNALLELAIDFLAAPLRFLEREPAIGALTFGSRFVSFITGFELAEIGVGNHLMKFDENVFETGRVYSFPPKVPY